jgi:hypothetical protein
MLLKYAGLTVQTSPGEGKTGLESSAFLYLFIPSLKTYLMLIHTPIGAIRFPHLFIIIGFL